MQRCTSMRVCSPMQTNGLVQTLHHIYRSCPCEHSPINVYICLYARIYGYTHIWSYCIHIYIYIYVYLYIYAHTQTCTYTCIGACICKCVCSCAELHASRQKHIYTLVCTCNISEHVLERS